MLPKGDGQILLGRFFPESSATNPPVKRPYFCDFARIIASVMVLNAPLFVISCLNEVFRAPWKYNESDDNSSNLKSPLRPSNGPSRNWQHCKKRWQISVQLAIFEKLNIWLSELVFLYKFVFLQKMRIYPPVFLQICARIRNSSHWERGRGGVPQNQPKVGRLEYFPQWVKGTGVPPNFAKFHKQFFIWPFNGKNPPNSFWPAPY